MDLVFVKKISVMQSPFPVNKKFHFISGGVKEGCSSKNAKMGSKFSENFFRMGEVADYSVWR